MFYGYINEKQIFFKKKVYKKKQELLKLAANNIYSCINNHSNYKVNIIIIIIKFIYIYLKHLEKIYYRFF